MAKSVQFSIKLVVDGREQVVSATTSTEELRKVVSETQTASDKFRNSLISLNQQFEAVKNVSENVSGKLAAVSDKLRAMRREYARVASVVGETGTSLKAVRSQAQAIASTFGGTFEEVLTASNSLMKGFGVSAEEALRLVRDGYVGGADANGEFLDTLREYPRYFKEAGLSAEEFVAITTNAAKQGVYSDKGVDTIKEGNLRIREMTEATAQALEAIGISSEDVQNRLQAGTLTTFEVMQMVGAKLAELPASSAKVGAAIADIFGGPGEDAGLEYIKSLASIETNMDAVTASADEYSQALGRQAQAQAESNSLFSAFDDIAMEVGSSLSGAMPYIDKATTAVTSMATAAITAKAAYGALSKVITGNAAVMKAWTTVSRLCSVSLVALKTSSHGAAVGAIALKVALRGLLITTGVGAAIAAITFGLEKLLEALDDTSDKSEGAARSVETSANIAKRAQEAFDVSGKQTYADLMTRYTQLQAQWKALADEHQKTAWIKENQSAFESLGVEIDNATDAEAAFVGNTSAVVDSFKQKARAAALMSQLTEEYRIQMELADKIATADTAAQKRHTVKAGDVVKGGSHTTEGGYEAVGSDGKWRYTEKGAARSNSVRWIANGPQTKQWRKALEESLSRSAKAEKEAEEAAKEATKTAKPYTPVKSDASKTGTSRTPTFVRKEKAKTDELSEIAGAKTENQLLNNIRYYEQQRGELAETAEGYKAWTDKIDEMQAALDGLRGKQAEVAEAPAAAPADISKLNTLEQLEEAVRYYSDAQQSQSATEIANTQRTINLLQKKRSALQAVAAIPTMQDEVGDIESKSGKSRRRAISRVDIDGRIDELQDMKMGGSVTGDQAKQIDSLIEQYKKLKRESAASFDTLQEGWGNVKGIGSGITSITDALETNGDAWATITGLVDGALQMYQSISGIVEIIKSLTGVTQAQIVAETTKTGATEADTMATTANAAAKSVETAASLTNSGAKSGEAIAEAASQGAKLPFPANIAAIAAGVAAVVAALSMIGSFSTGGIVGGNSASGDKLLARVNSGEMILNRRQQQRMLDILSGKAFGAAVPERYNAVNVGGGIALDTLRLRSVLQPQAGGGDIRMEVRGRKLVGVLANETRVSGKSGRRTNIKL